MPSLRALLALALFLATLASPGAARTRENVTRLAPEETRRLPTALANQRVSMDGHVNDLFLFAQYGSVTGRVDDNLYVFSQSVELSGSVGGDVYAFCQTLRLSGQVAGDLYLGGGELHIEPGARVGGCLLGGVGTAALEGRVEGPVHLAAGELWINGEFMDDVALDAGTLSLGPGALLHGNVDYEAEAPAARDPAARVEGDLTYRERVVVQGDAEGARSTNRRHGAAWRRFGFLVWRVLGLFILGAVLMAVGGERARRPSAQLDARLGLSLGVGALVGLIVPAASVVAMLLVLPLPLGLVGLLGYAIALALAGPVVGLWVGCGLLTLSGRPPARGPGYGSLALGLAVLALIGLIPYLGVAIRVLVLVAGLGALSLALRRRDADSATRLAS